MEGAGHVVAIKRLKGQYTGCFEQEARAIAALNHPNICVLYDIGPDYLVIDYEPGFSTKRLLVRTPRGLPMEYENAQKRILDVLGQWKARALLTARLAGMPLAPSM